MYLKHIWCDLTLGCYAKKKASGETRDMQMHRFTDTQRRCLEGLKMLKRNVREFDG